MAASIRIPSRLDTPLGPTPERARIANDNFVVDPVTRAYHLKDTPIERLHKAGKISTLHLEAAKRFYADYYSAGLAPLGAQDYERPIVDSSTVATSISDSKLGSRDRYNAACKALGSFFLPTIDWVVLREMPLDAAGNKLGYKNYPQALTGGGDRTASGLEILVRHYGLSN